MNASDDMAAATEAGAGGLPTAGVVTFASGPLGAAVQAVRTAQQISRPQPVRVRIIVPSQACPGIGSAAVHVCLRAASGLVRAARSAGYAPASRPTTVPMSGAGRV